MVFNNRSTGACFCGAGTWLVGLWWEGCKGGSKGRYHPGWCECICSRGQKRRRRQMCRGIRRSIIDSQTATTHVFNGREFGAMKNDIRDVRSIADYFDSSLILLWSLKSLKVLENPWNSSKLLESPWKSLKVLESPWKSVSLSSSRECHIGYPHTLYFDSSLIS